MNIDGQPYRTIWLEDEATVKVIDQRSLPHELVLEPLRTVEEAARAIREMYVRGAPLIGVTAAYGLYLATRLAPSGTSREDFLRNAAQELRSTRPTAVDLFFAIDRMMGAILKMPAPEEQIAAALQTARMIEEESVEHCRRIGQHGLALIEACRNRKNGEPVNILTHCNAGWLACIDYGTATAPVYLAHDQGIAVHVWVDETRPRNQGARITAYELGQHGVPHTVITDNAGGHLMQHGMVDLVIVGSDRTTRTGDVANKIGTYLKALAAHDNGVPFYVALPSSTIDWTLRDGIRDIPIEQRAPEEVTHIQGWNGAGMEEVLLTPAGSRAANFGFDVTPARLVTGLITERGICAPNESGLLNLYPEKKQENT